MATIKPLLESEVPQEFQQYLDFSKQYTTKWANGKTRAVVSGICPLCLEPKEVTVNDVRNFLRGQRKSRFPIVHRECRYPKERVTAQGYVQIYDRTHPNANAHGYVMKHRWVVSQEIGRPLEETETVHHIDGDRQNNDLSNLQLRSSNHGRGQVRICGDCGSTNITAMKL